MSTVLNLVLSGARRLLVDDARREAEILLAHALHQSRAWLVAHGDDVVDDARCAAFEALIARRAAGEPLAYLTGTRGFYDLELEVSPEVLIPRPETELLVDLALQRIPLGAESTIVDLGTGSGAIALAIAKARPDARIVATDASEAALAVARNNAVRLGLSNVDFEQGDWCAALGAAHFDLIVSNPPYVAEGDPHLGEGDLRFEPALALSSGADGLDAIRVVVRDSRAHLKAGGWLLFEHGYGQAAAVRTLLKRTGYREGFTARDLEGRERVSGGRLKQHGDAGSGLRP